mmetsp:Transcript_33632/g.78665  ORF Transcript_33632/g.78665 Transcript_33632/m.78665 type:complete len:316 (+) Transcript_33632:615-1562(+)
MAAHRAAAEKRPARMEQLAAAALARLRHTLRETVCRSKYGVAGAASRDGARNVAGGRAACRGLARALAARVQDHLRPVELLYDFDLAAAEALVSFNENIRGKRSVEWAGHRELDRRVTRAVHAGFLGEAELVRASGLHHEDARPLESTWDLIPAEVGRALDGAAVHVRAPPRVRGGHWVLAAAGCRADVRGQIGEQQRPLAPLRHARGIDRAGGAVWPLDAILALAHAAAGPCAGGAAEGVCALALGVSSAARALVAAERVACVGLRRRAFHARVRVGERRAVEAGARGEPARIGLGAGGRDTINRLKSLTAARE